jgi:hypothetical protein
VLLQPNAKDRESDIGDVTAKNRVDLLDQLRLNLGLCRQRKEYPCRSARSCVPTRKHKVHNHTAKHVCVHRVRERHFIGSGIQERCQHARSLR